jgi:hypothetical protein
MLSINILQSFGSEVTSFDNQRLSLTTEESVAHCPIWIVLVSVVDVEFEGEHDASNAAAITGAVAFLIIDITFESDLFFEETALLISFFIA